MIWEALVWTMQKVSAAIQSSLDWVLPASFTEWYRGAITEWGLGGLGALTGFFHPAALGAFGATVTLGFVLVGIAITVRLIRAVVAWIVGGA